MSHEEDPFDGDEDAALRYAIELSLQEAGGVPPPSAGDAIEISSDEDDDDDLESGGSKYPSITKNAPETGSGDKNPSTKKTDPSIQMSSASKKSEAPPPPSSGLNLLAGLDRKKMEEERLARMGKRKADDDTAELEGSSQKRKQQRGGNAHVVSSANKPLAAPKETNPHQHHHLPYPKGSVKKTWAAGYPRTGDDIKIEEVLQKNELQLAVLSSFQWDDEWMLKNIDITRTKIILIAYASGDEHKAAMQANIPSPMIRFCFPPMLPMGNMHSKLQLLKYPKYLRIVVPTGNLVPYDWGETGVMENSVFIIDLPRLDKSQEASGVENLTAFGQDLCYFLKAQGLDDGLINSLAKYNFAETKDYGFVHSIGQSHVDGWQRTGYCGLGRAVKNLGLATSHDVNIDFIMSSMGSVNLGLLSQLYYAAQGDDGTKELDARQSKAKKSGAKAPSLDLATLRDKFRLYFPSEETVVQSRGGRGAGGTIFTQSKWWDSPTFPRELVHDCKSVRSGLLMHSKMLMVRHSAQPPNSRAWAYVGSANMSESAWGRLVRERSSGNVKLTCRNWECGVVVPVPASPARGNEKQAKMLSPSSSSKELLSSSSSSSSTGTARPLSSVFKSVIPVPIQEPSQRYGDSRMSKRPWFAAEMM